MASFNLSDMLTRQLFRNALKSMPTSVAHAVPTHSPAVTQLGNLKLNLSTFDRPAAETIEENSYYDKYKEKLAKAKQSKPKDYEAALDRVYGRKTSDAPEQPVDIKGSSVLERMQASSTSKSKPQDGVSSPKRKDLNSILKLELLQDKSASEITQIWNRHYSGKDGVIFASIPKEKYERLRLKGKEHPLFVYPLPRDAGYEFMLGQYSEDDWYYTPLIAYQTHGEYAPHSLAIHHYTELAGTKGIVLMVGEIAADELKPELATLLVHQTQLIYGSDENFELVKQMHEKPNDFKHMDVIDLCKKAALF